jgi:fatty-acyl-CoA synthase
MAMDLAHWIERHAAFTPDKIALRGDGHDLSYAAMARRVSGATARFAELGVAQGDVVAFLGHNNPLMIVALFACARLGAMLMPLNWRLTAAEHARVLALCPPRVLLTEPAFLGHAQELAGGCPVEPEVMLCGDLPADSALKLAPVAAANGETPVLICHTSGSTGAPKAVVLSQDALFVNAVNSTHMHDLTSADRVLTTLPLFHVGGLNIQTLPALHAGATVTLHAKFEAAAAIEAIEREKITLTVLVPAQLIAMMEHPRWETADLSSLRVVTTGSTIVSEAFVRRVQARGLRVIQIYGSTETCPIAAYQRPADAERKAGSAGQPALHCELRVVDENGRDQPPGAEGEIIVRGRNVMRGYLNAPQANAAALRDGWYHTSDVGRFDEDGFLYVVARKSEMIISGGENIYPAELEVILAECPAIREACVIGRRDDRWGEVVTAFVALQSGAQMTEESVIALFSGRIARYKHPRVVRFVEALPRNELGKIKRSVLQAEADPTPA